MPSIDGRKNQATMPDQGNVADAAVTDPTALASMIAMLKGILSQLQGTGSGALDVDVSDRAARDLGKVDIAGIDAVGTIAGQKAMAASIPVVISSDQSDVNVNLNTALSDEVDSIDVSKMSKGSVTTAHDTITATATSAEIDCRGHNGVVLHMEGSLEASQTWIVEILGAPITGGTFGKGYYPQDFEHQIGIDTADLATDGVVNFGCKGINNYIKIRATLSGGTATLTVKVTPINL